MKLDALIAKLPKARKRGILPWYERLEQENPKLMAEINEVINLWESKKKYRDKFHERTGLARWIGDIVGQNQQPIIAYMKKRNAEKPGR